MDVQMKLDEIAGALEGARSMPMSASCVVNRAELLGMLNEVREALPGSLAQAQQLLGGREQLVEEARREAEQIVEEAQSRRSALISDTEVARSAQAEADRILAEARQEAEQIRAEADDYVDSKLANFEVVLTKTIGSVDRGRDKLLGRDPGYDDPNAFDPQTGETEGPERSADPQEQRRRADEYVEAQFRAFGSVLAKTLEAVGRGRQKLQGARPIDQLGAHLEQQGGQQLAGSDDSYLADLADSQQPFQPPAQPAVQPSVQQVTAPQPAPAAAAAYYDGAPQGYDAHDYQQPHEQYQVQQVQQAQPYPGGYEQAYGQGYAQGYEQPDPGYDWSPQPPQQAGYTQSPAVLDETSLFDTGLIDMEQVRQYDDRGRP